MRKPLAITLTVISLLVITTCAVLLLKPTTQAEQQQVIVFTPQALLVEANRLRAEKGVAPLKLDERLNTTAQERADDMAKRNYFSHYDPVTGKNLVNVGSTYPGMCSSASENIQSDADIYHNNNPFDAKEGWQTSPAHYAALIDAKYNTTGFGIVVTNGQIYYVQHFCDLR